MKKDICLMMTLDESSELWGLLMTLKDNIKTSGIISKINKFLDMIEEVQKDGKKN